MRCRVELVYDQDCPNVHEARAVLLRAFAHVGISPAWVEWDRKAPDTPGYAKGYGSPTILVDGKDVAGAEPSADADCCRLYSDGKTGFRGVPPVEQVVVALSKNVPELDNL
jgi:mercuric ion transport protein